MELYLCTETALDVTWGGKQILDKETADDGRLKPKMTKACTVVESVGWT